MTVPDHTLMAYADGELDDAARELVEAAMREDPEVRKRVAEHRALRDALQKGFADELDEPVPERLLSAVRKPLETPAGKVLPMSAARDRIRGKEGESHLRRWRGAPSFAMAASLLLGLGLGYWVHRDANSLLRATPGDGVIAGGALSSSLSTQLSADHPAGAVATIGLSFKAKSGAYCRTFSLEGSATSGLACREGKSWKILMLGQKSHPGAAGEGYRMAASGDSGLLRSAVEEVIRGEPLDRAGEVAARRSGWAP